MFINEKENKINQTISIDRMGNKGTLTTKQMTTIGFDGEMK